MMKLLTSAAYLAICNAEGAGEGWNWEKMTTSQAFDGKDYGTNRHFDNNYFAMLMGTGGVDFRAIHQSKTMPKVGLTSMEKVKEKET